MGQRLPPEVLVGRKFNLAGRFVSTRQGSSSGARLTGRDRAYASIYIQLLDATAAGADWQIIAQDVLKLDPRADAETAKRSFDRFYARAVWMTEVGYKLLLKSGR